MGQQASAVEATPISLFVDVPKEEVARLVGAKGANVHRIQDATGVFIRSPPREAEPHPDGTVSFLIKGKAASCFAAYTMLQEQLPGPCVFSAVELSLERPSDVALLIGEKGQSIRKIQQETNAKVVTRPREERSSVVAIEGAPDDVHRAYAMMWETIAANRAEKAESAKQNYRSSRSVGGDAEAARPPRTPTRERDNNRSDNNRNDSGGSPSTPGSGSAIPRSYKDASPGSFKKKGGEASPDRAWGAPRAPKFAGGSPATADARQSSPAAAPASPGTGGGAAVRSPASSDVRQSPQTTSDEPTVQTEVPFPADKAGLLFGKEGATIKLLKRKSRAVVFIDVKAGVVRLQGTESQTRTAEELVKEILNRPTKPRREPRSPVSASGESSPAVAHGVAAVPPAAGATEAVAVEAAASAPVAGAVSDTK